MKATAQSITVSAPVEKSWFAVAGELVKARLTSLVLITTALGFYLGSQGPLNYLLLLHTMLGTGLLAAGAAILNQWMERDFDAKMRRTEDRPLPSGRVAPEHALWLGIVVSAAGAIYLAVGVNLLCFLLGVVTHVSYVMIYTPLKRVTPFNTVVGAVPGALPPLMGWVAASGQLTAAGWTLFAILFFWQLPHFYAIDWMYREDYERAGFKMLSGADPDGFRIGRMSVTHTLGLLVMSFFPFLFRIVGVFYLAGAVLLGVLFLLAAIHFCRRLDRSAARLQFFASIIYLPLLTLLMVLDKT